MEMSDNIRFEDWKARQMKDPEFRAAREALEPAYQVARLRIMQGLTQKQLAKLVGTRQSSISRLESGDSQPSLSFLRRVVKALGGRLEVRVISQEEAAAASQQSVIDISQPDTYSDDKIIRVPNWPCPEGHQFQYDWTDRASTAPC